MRQHINSNREPGQSNDEDNSTLESLTRSVKLLLKIGTNFSKEQYFG